MRGAAVASVVVGVALAATWAAARPVESAPLSREADAFVRGVALGLFATDPEWDYQPLVDEIRARGATDVLVVVNAVQSNRFSSDIALRPGRSPSTDTVRRTLRQVREAGMRAALMPVVRLDERAPHEWRGVIAPADGLDAWFGAYRRLLLPLAAVAEEEGAQRFVVGSELSSLERYDVEWRETIGQVRALYSGAVTYSANWDHADAVPFWDALDEVGMTAYFPLGEHAATSSDALARAWKRARTELDALRRRTGKPVVVTEVGYPSKRGAAAHPWDDTGSQALDLGGQQRLYRGFCDAFHSTPSVSGFYVWNWFGFGGPRDDGFTPRGKPAAAELQRCFARDWSARSRTGNPS